MFSLFFFSTGHRTRGASSSACSGGVAIPVETAPIPDDLSFILFERILEFLKPEVLKDSLRVRPS